MYGLWSLWETAFLYANRYMRLYYFHYARTFRDYIVCSGSILVSLNYPHF